MFFRFLPISYLPFFLLCTFLVAQEETRPTVAILDFEGLDISIQEVQTLTERMRTEIGNTNAVRLIERKAIESIMAEQGLTQSGCVTDECAAQVGQLLGVQFMINGSIGKIGDSFTIDVKMFSVETGVTERSKNVTYDGDIEGLLVEMQILSWEIVGLEAPPALKLKRAGDSEKQTVAILDFEGRGMQNMRLVAIPEDYALHHNYPNPFNPITTMLYDLPETGHTRLIIYDLLGREVHVLIDKVMNPGYYSTQWNGRNSQGQMVGAGVYLYQIQAGEYISTKKMILLK